jgi:hypothetical protein
MKIKKYISSKLAQFKYWILSIVIGRFYYPDQIEGALHYGYMLGIWRKEAVERMNDEKVQKLMDDYISDLDKANAL